MAFNLIADVPFVLSARILDNNDNVGNMSVNLPSTANDVQLAAWVAAAGLALPALTDGYVQSITLTKSWVNDAENLLNQSSEVERKLIIPFRGAGNVRAQVSVPSPLFTLEQNGTDLAVQTNPALVAFIAFMLNGAPGFTQGVVNLNGLPLTSTEPAIVRHRNRKPSK